MLQKQDEDQYPSAGSALICLARLEPEYEFLHFLRYPPVWSKYYYFFLFTLVSSLGIEPSTAINQFFYREPPLPIGSPTLINI